jgi:hypothetical protein
MFGVGEHGHMYIIMTRVEYYVISEMPWRVPMIIFAYRDIFRELLMIIVYKYKLFFNF